MDAVLPWMDVQPVDPALPFSSGPVGALECIIHQYYSAAIVVRQIKIVRYPGYPEKFRASPHPCPHAQTLPRQGVRCVAGSIAFYALRGVYIVVDISVSF